MTKIQLSGHISPDQEKTYLHLPFDVPPGAARLEVRYAYSQRIGSDPHLSGGNTLDLGVFDERGTDFLSAGFRGWSGSERTTFTISEDAATPGYLAGALNSGRWHVLLGLYKIASAGCDYTVEITITQRQGRRTPPLPSARGGDLPASPPPARGSPWLLGELHCHSLHSDGAFSPTELIHMARERGLDFLAISDHNSTAAQRELEAMADPGLILLRGVEVTTFKGHFNVWGIPDWVDFRVQRAEDMRAALRFAAGQGGLTSCGHPKPFGPPWDYAEVTDYDCIEVWNGPWDATNEVALANWVGQLAAGRRLPALGGSDFHRIEPPGTPPRALGAPAVWVYLPGRADAAGILRAIRAGHVSLGEGPDGAMLELRAGEGYAVLAGDALPAPAGGKLLLQVRCLRGAGGRLALLDQRGARFEYEIGATQQTVAVELPIAGSRYVRAELRAPGGRLLALTNPVYLG